MVISIEPHAAELLDLLWIRGAWGLHPVGDLPPELEVAPLPLSKAGALLDDKRRWEAACRFGV